MTGPRDDSYSEEAAVRDELTRVFDVCNGCRRCVDACASFTSLFAMLDAQSTPDAGLFTPAQQDVVIDGCVQCMACTAICPYTPDRDELAIDFARTMLRGEAMRFENDHVSFHTKRVSRVFARPDRTGRLATWTAGVANTIVTARPGSFVRRVLAGVSGVSARRLLAPFADERFSTWFERRPTITMQRKQASVTVFPTCLVEHQAVGVGRDLVKVYERNGVECGISAARCCGAPLLHAGDTARFAKVARRNVSQLVAEVRRGTDIVVPQPTCAAVIRREYPAHVGGADAQLVAEHTFDASQYLMTLHRADDYVLDTQFDGHVPSSITYHQSAYLRVDGNGFVGRDLMRLTGAPIRVVQEPAGVHGLWGLQTGKDDAVEAVAARLEPVISRVGGDQFAGDCHLENTMIRELTGREVLHPIQVLARAYGIADDV